MEKVYEFLKGCGPFYFATVDNGEARVRPFGFTMMFEGKLYFGVGTHKASYREMLANDRVELCAMSQSEKGAFIRVRGKAVMDPRDQVQEAMYQSAPMLKNTYNEQTGHRHECFYLEDMSAVVSRMGIGEEKIY